MDIQIPPSLQWVSYLAGDQWPQGSESGMDRINEILKSAADELDGLIPDLNRVRGETLSVLMGETAEVADRHFAMLFGGDYAVDKLSDGIRALGESASYTGIEIEYSKLSILVGLALAAAEIAYALAMAAPTWGASTAAIPVIEWATITSIRQLISLLLRRVGAKVRDMLARTSIKRLVHEGFQEAGEELAIAATQEAIVAGIQGDRYRVNKERLLLNGIASTVGGAAGGATAVPTANFLGPAATRWGAAGKGATTFFTAGVSGNFVGTLSVNGEIDPFMMLVTSTTSSVGGLGGAGVAPGRTTNTNLGPSGGPPPGAPAPPDVGPLPADPDDTETGRAEPDSGVPADPARTHSNGDTGARISEPMTPEPTAVAESETNGIAAQDLSTPATDVSGSESVAADRDAGTAPAGEVITGPDSTGPDSTGPASEATNQNTSVTPVADSSAPTTSEAATVHGTPAEPTGDPAVATPEPSATSAVQSPAAPTTASAPTASAPTSSAPTSTAPASPSSAPTSSTATPNAAPSQSHPAAGAKPAEPGGRNLAAEAPANRAVAANDAGTVTPAARHADTTARPAAPTVEEPAHAADPAIPVPDRTDCLDRIAEKLSEKLGRTIQLADFPSPRGRPAVGLFQALGLGSEFATYTEVRDALTEMGHGSVAVLTSAWRGSPQRGGHAYLAINDNGTIRFEDAFSRRQVGWPPPWGEAGVLRTAVGYLHANGEPRQQVDGPQRLVAAAAIGDVAGPPLDDGTVGSPDSPGERWQAVVPPNLVADSALQRRGLDPDRAAEVRNPLGLMQAAAERARDNAAWWDSLTGAEQRALIETYPEHIGNSEGIPATARHAANMLTLGRDRTQLQTWRDRGLRLTSLQRKELARLNRITEALARARAAAQHAEVCGPLLLALDTTAFNGNGRVLVSFGTDQQKPDPYQADSVSWHVPGEGITIDQVGACMADALNHLQSTRAENSALNAASIAWIGYDAPSGRRSWRAAGRKLARAGGAILYSDIRAFNTARDARAGDGSTFAGNHIFAHSYGSTATSYAGRNGRLAGSVSTITLVGSPGAGPLRSADDFQIGERNVYVASSARDPFTALGGRTPGSTGRFFGRGLGVDPAMESFNAQRVSAQFDAAMDRFSSRGTHNSYYRFVDTGTDTVVRTESLANFGRIAAGRPDLVQREAHRRVHRRRWFRPFASTVEPAASRPLHLDGDAGLQHSRDRLRRKPWTPRWAFDAGPAPAPYVSDLDVAAVRELLSLRGVDSPESMMNPAAIHDQPRNATTEANAAWWSGLTRAQRRELIESDPQRIGNAVGIPSADLADARARANAVWWAGLSSDQRALMTAVFPHEIGNAEGIFAADRDRANRSMLQRYRARADDLLAVADNGGRVSKDERQFIDRVYRIDQGLRDGAEAARAANVGGPLLLAFDPLHYGGDGRAVLSFASDGTDPDPQRAASVSWHIPGVNTTIDDAGNFHDPVYFYMRGALAQLQSTMQEAPGISAASMLWIGYDAPNQSRFWQPAANSRARTGGDVLYSDIRAFNAARNTWAADGSTFRGNHIFGHSYGSTTTSYAGHRGRLASLVSTVTLLGSPGAGPLKNAADFGIGANVYVAASSSDPITGLGSRTSRWTGRLLGTGLGIDPAMAAFGANRITSEFAASMNTSETVGTHRSYYAYADTAGQIRSESLANFGRIAAGRSGLDIHHEAHRTPDRRPWYRLGLRTVEPAAGRPLRLDGDAGARQFASRAGPRWRFNPRWLPANECGPDVIDFLSGRHNRTFTLAVAATAQGVPARAVFQALGSAAQLSTYRQIYSRLRAMAPGSSAVLASSWASDGGRRGGHAYVAVYDGTDVFLWDPYTRTMSGWPPYWGENSVAQTAVGYLKPDGEPVTKLQDPVTQLSDADEIGSVAGQSGPSTSARAIADAALQLRGVSSADDLMNPAGTQRRGLAAVAVPRARANATWWQGLSESQRQALVSTYPRQIGNAEGIFAADRDAANRRMYDRYRIRAAEIQAAIDAGRRISDRELNLLLRVNKIGTGLRNAAVAAEQAGVGGPLLLAFDPLAFNRDGRAVICFSSDRDNPDPYRADSVSWHVPGIRSTISSMTGFYMEGALNVLRSTLQENPNLSAASMLWIGYDAPNDSHEWRAAGRKLAKAGGEILYSDIVSFNAARDIWAGDGSRFRGNHVMGHSYGSTTTSYAGIGGRLAGHVETITLLGSPGAGPQRSAADFGIGADNVFVASSSYDFITALGGRTPGEAGRILGRGLGIDPVIDVFGARRVTSEFPAAMNTWQTYATHRSYYSFIDTEAGIRSESLANLGRIQAGHPERLDFEAHRRAEPRPGFQPGSRTVEPAAGRPLRLEGEARHGARRDPLQRFNPRWRADDSAEAHRLEAELSSTDVDDTGDDATAVTREEPPQRGIDRTLADAAVARRVPTVNVDDLCSPLGRARDAIGSAQANRAWWSRLSDTARHALIQAYPRQIGNADGIPTVDRDAANRELLRRYRTRADQIQTKIDAGQRPSEVELAFLRRVNHIDAALREGVLAAQRIGAEPPALLALDPVAFGGGGRMLLSFGADPLAAESVSWHIARRSIEDSAAVVGAVVDHLQTDLAETRSAAVVWIGDPPARSRTARNAFYSDLATFRALRDSLAEAGEARPLISNRVHAVTGQRTGSRAPLWLPAGSDKLVFAHRGGVGVHQENSLAAFRSALAAGANALECDVQLSKDGQVVVIHDPWLNRTTSASGFVSNRTAAELNRLGVPTLAQLLELTGQHGAPVTLFIEVKHFTARYNHNIERQVVAVLEAYGLTNPTGEARLRPAVISFHPDGLRRIRGLAPNLPTILLAPPLPSLAALPALLATARWAGVQAIGLPKAVPAFPEAVDLAHRAGFNVWSGVVHDALTARYLVDVGVDILGSDDPAQIRGWLDGESRQPGPQAVPDRDGTDSVASVDTAPDHPTPQPDASAAIDEPASREPVTAESALAKRIPPVQPDELRNPVNRLDTNREAMAVEAAARARNNAAWWRALSTAERTAVIEAYPAHIGNAEGIPPADRDIANRAVLRQLQERADAIRTRTSRFEWISLQDRRLLNRVNTIDLALQNAARDAERAGEKPPLLLAFDPAEFGGDGRAVISFGDDPYTAESVSWHAPGIGSTVNSRVMLGFNLDSALNHLRATRAAAEPGTTVASLAWIGYDAPSGLRKLHQMLRQRFARIGGDILHSDITAFNAGRDRWTADGSRFTGNHVFGYSYGSTTAAYAGRDGRLADQVRTISLIGSPGAGPQRSAADFGVGADRVFVASSSRDLVPSLGGRTPRSAGRLFGIGLGHDPAMDTFGAVRVAAEAPRSMNRPQVAGTHDTYFRYTDAADTRAGEALGNLGRIAAEDYANLRREQHRTAQGRGTLDPAAARSTRRWWNPTWRQPNCAQAVADRLSQRYGRPFTLDTRPTWRGVPARSLFQAAGVDAQFADYDEIAARLRELGPGSSAIVASRWRGWRGGGHTYLAVNDNGQIHLWDLHSGQQSSGWPPHWGADAVARSAVGYLDTRGEPAGRPDVDVPLRLDAADSIGHVKGGAPEASDHIVRQREYRANTDVDRHADTRYADPLATVLDNVADPAHVRQFAQDLSGRYGPFSVRFDGVRLNNEIMLNGTILDGGVDIGTVQLEFSRDSAGDLVVGETGTRVDKAGRGFYTALHRELESYYLRSGVDRIESGTHFQGSAAAARRGFVWDPRPTPLRDTLGRVRGALDRMARSGISAEGRVRLEQILRRFNDRNPPELIEIASLNTAAEPFLGRRVLESIEFPLSVVKYLRVQPPSRGLQALLRRATAPPRGARYDCAQRALDVLSAMYGRDFRLEIAPSRRGTPARAVFAAVQSASRFATYDEVAVELRRLGDGSAALLASQWEGTGRRQAGHAYLARNIGGEIFLIDPFNGARSGWPPHWGQSAVARTAVGYLDTSGEPVDRLAGPGALTAAGEIGRVAGHPGGATPDPVRELGLPRYPAGSLSDRDARAAYIDAELRLRDLNQRLISEGVDVRERARRLSALRDALRSWTRDTMSNRVVADFLTVYESAPTFAELVAHNEAKGLTGDAVYEAIVYSATHSHYAQGTLSDHETRTVYTRFELRMREVREELIGRGLDLETQARTMYDMRAALRTWTRALMADREYAEWLNANEPNPTFDQLVERQRQKRRSGDEVFRSIIASATRSRPSVNDSLNIDPDNPPPLPPMRGRPDDDDGVQP